MCTIHTRESQSSVCVSPYHRQRTSTQILKMGIVWHTETVHLATGRYLSHGSGDQAHVLSPQLDPTAPSHQTTVW